MRQLQQRQIATWFANQLHTHGQTSRVETYRDADTGQTCQRGQNDDLHPAVVGVHGFASDVGRPAFGDIKWPNLRAREG